MTDPIYEQGEVFKSLQRVMETAEEYIRSLPDRLVYDVTAEPLLSELGGPLPETGIGTLPAVERLLRVGSATATASSGPRYYHLVVGGSTPAALAADWIVSLLDQNALARVGSRFADEAETVALQWLRELFELPTSWGGALTASATFANFTGLGCATHWWGERQGVDVATAGLSGLPRMPVMSGGYVHPSSRKALQMLGHGRDSVQVFTRDAIGRVDLSAMEQLLKSLGGAPAVIIATAGEPNAGDFDPIADLAELADRYGAWLHVDGAFGVFAALSPRTAHLVDGMERADSIAGDGHKWLNVPYESGFLLTREPERLGRAFGMPGAAYLPGPGDPNAGYMMLGPEFSRRARALPIWATLAAYGRDGYRSMIERHCELAKHLATRVDEAPDMELLNDVKLNVVCFRYRPASLSETELDRVNDALGETLLTDGRVFAGTSIHDGHVVLRPAISNWCTTEGDLNYLVDVVREIGSSILTSESNQA
ncbi:pyridoxal phosphate-dependent decarboxylase family protein [Streptomyces sp. NPDC002285]